MVECVNEEGEIGLYMSWNSGKSNIRQPMVRIPLFIIFMVQNTKCCIIQIPIERNEFRD